MLDGISLKIEEMAKENGGSYMEAVLDFQEQHEIPDVEDITENLHKNIIEKLKEEIIRKNFLGKDSKFYQESKAIPSEFFED